MSRDLQQWITPGGPPLLPGAVAGSPAARVRAGDLSRVLLRRKLVLLLALCLGLAFGFWLSVLKPARYSAEGLLVIDTASLAIPELSPLASGRTAEPWGGRSEAQILTARETVAAAVDRLGLVDDPAFNADLAPSLAERLLGWARQAPWLPPDAVRLIETHAPPGLLERRAVEPAEARAAIIDAVRRRLDARSEERSYAITLRYTAPTAAAAAGVVNAVMTAYVERDQAVKRASLAEARSEIERRLEEIGQELAEARLRLGRLEGESGLVLGEAGTIRARALDALVAEGQALRVEQERVRADLARIETALAGRADVALRGPLVTPRLEQLWQQEALIVREIAETGEDLGPRHPAIVRLRGRLAGIERAIRDEVRGLSAGLASEAALLDQRAERLAQLIEAGQQEAASDAEGRVVIELARQEVASLRELHDIYRERYERTLASAALVGPDARIVSAAEPPIRPDGPDRLLLAGIGGLMGLVLASGGIVARRWLGDRLMGPEDIARTTGLPVLGVLPVVPRRRGGLPGVVAKAPEGPESEMLRAILTRLGAPDPDGRARAVLVSSSRAGDGKTSFSLALARVATRDGLRCLVIEGDCRRPGLRGALGKDGSALKDGEPSTPQLPYTIMVDAEGGAHVLAARPLAQMAPALLRSERFGLLFANARAYYDLIVIDGPPLLATADSLLLAAHADLALLVVPAGQGKGTELATAASRVAATGLALAGAVLNRCPPPLPATHAYAGYATRPGREPTLSAP